MKNIRHDKRWINFALCVLLLCSSYYTFRVIRDGWQQMSFSPQARVEMKHLFGRLQLGQTRSQVQAVFDAGKYHKLSKSGTSRDSEWTISTPFEFGSGNWILYIHFGRKNEVAALKLRTIDNMNERPREPAPTDKIAL